MRICPTGAFHEQGRKSQKIPLCDPSAARESASDSQRHLLGEPGRVKGFPGRWDGKWMRTTTTRGNIPVPPVPESHIPPFPLSPAGVGLSLSMLCSHSVFSGSRYPPRSPSHSGPPFRSGAAGQGQRQFSITVRCACASGAAASQECGAGGSGDGFEEAVDYLPREVGMCPRPGAGSVG